MNHRLGSGRSPDFYRALPKVELHRHLEGSVRLVTLQEIGRAHGMPIPTTGRLRDLVQVRQNDSFNFENFLSKFQTLRLFYRSPQAIYRITRETIQDAASDRVRYMELRFTPVALSRAERFPLANVMDWVIEAAHSAGQEFGVIVRLIASVNRQEPLEQAEEVIRLACERLDQGVVGVDLAGNEAHFSGSNFAPLFQTARQAGLHITIHAGEWGGAENVRIAIEDLGAERIGHGIRVLEDPQVALLARQRNIPFEVCITSNYQSGAVPNLVFHPITRMLNLGLNVTLNTDDPSISQITLGDEYQSAGEELGLSIAALRQRILAAARGAFLPPLEKENLVQALENELDQLI